MAERIKQLQQDVSQLQNLINYLAQYVSKLKTELDTLNSVKPIQTPVKQQTPPPLFKQEIDTTNYIPLTKYAWDQQGSKVKIIFSLQGVGEECTKDQVDISFGGSSVELRLRGYRGQNYIFGIKKLCGDINAVESKYLLKKNGITIVLVKKDTKSWAQLPFKEEKFEGKKEKEEEKDPGANIMGMMKKMYDEGDENMKKTIAEAWTKANDKKGEKGEQPDFSNRYDFLKK